MPCLIEDSDSDGGDFVHVDTSGMPCLIEDSDSDGGDFVHDETSDMPYLADDSDSDDSTSVPRSASDLRDDVSDFPHLLYDSDSDDADSVCDLVDTWLLPLTSHDSITLTAMTASCADDNPTRLQFLADSGANAHFSHLRHLFYNFTPCGGSITVGKSGTTCRILGQGDLHMKGSDGQFTLKNVRFSPDLGRNLLSISAFIRGAPGHVVTISDSLLKGESVADRRPVFTAHLSDNNLFIVNALPVPHPDTSSSLAAFPASDVDQPDSLVDLAESSMAIRHRLCHSLWHRRFGHIAPSTIISMAKSGVVAGLPPLLCVPSPTEILEGHFCRACAVGTQRKNVIRRHMDFPVVPPRVSPIFPHPQRGEFLRGDIWGPARVPSRGEGFHYYLVVRCESTHMIFLCGLVARSDGLKALLLLFERLKNQSNVTVKTFTTDNEGCFVSKQALRTFAERGISLFPLPPDSPSLNGGIEQVHRIVGNVRATLNQANLSDNFWFHSLLAQVHVKVRISDTSLFNRTPIEAWTGQVPSVSHLRVWGCSAYPLKLDQTRKAEGKLRPIAKEAVIFIAYVDDHGQYLFYDAATSKLIKSRNAWFDEFPDLVKGPLRQLSSADTFAITGVVPPDFPASDVPAIDFDDQIPTQPAAVPAVSPPSPFAPDSTPQPDSSSPNPPTDPSASHQALTKLQNSLIAINQRPTPRQQSSMDRESSMTALIADHYHSKHGGALPVFPVSNTTTIDVHDDTPIDDSLPAEYFLFSASIAATVPSSPTAPLPHNSDIPIDHSERFPPKSDKDISTSPNRIHWLRAKQKEFSGIIGKGTRTSVPLPQGAVALRGIYVYRITRDPLTTLIIKFKARFVVLGNHQTDGVNFDKDHIYAPTAKMSSFRLLLAIAARHNLSADMIDVVQAFLNANLDTDINPIYIRQPPGNDDGSGNVWLLNKALYGLRQAPAEWYRTMASHLIKHGYTRSFHDESVFTKLDSHGNVTTMMAVHVDDSLIVGSDTSIAECKRILQLAWDLEDKGPVETLLGIVITRDRTTKVVNLNQHHYIQQLLDDFNMTDCLPVSIPMVTAGIDLTVRPLLPKCDKPYRALIGGLMWLMVCTRPDIAASVGILCRYLTTYQDAHWNAALRILQYLKGTLSVTLTLGSCQTGHDDLHGYSDSDYAGCETTRRSTGGWCFFYANSLISWKSKRAAIVALSTAEAELMGMTDAAKEAIWIRGLLQDLQHPQAKASLIFGDNQGALAMVRNGSQHSRSKHIAVREFFIREKVYANEVNVVYISTHLNISDIFTKPLDRVKLQSFRDALGVL